MSGEPIVVGHFPDVARMAPITGVGLELRALELVAHWRRCGLTADWLAQFLAYDFEPDTRETAVSILSTVINEMLENAAKFCADKQRSVRVSVHHHGDFIGIETLNVAGSPQVQLLRSTFDELESDPLEEVFARRARAKTAPGAPGIGLLILKKDYGARLGARITAAGAEQWSVCVRVELDVREVEQK